MKSRTTKAEKQETDATGADDARRVFLDEAAATAGQLWSMALRKDLTEQGRAAAGGFPGTMSEVRTQVNVAVGQALRVARMHALEHDERERTARVAYAAARKDWLANGIRDPDEDD